MISNAPRTRRTRGIRASATPDRPRFRQSLRRHLASAWSRGTPRRSRRFLGHPILVICTRRVARAAAFVLALGAPSTMVGCFSYSSYQSARILKKGQRSTTVAASHNRTYDVHSQSEEDEFIHLGGTGRVGMGNGMDMGLKLDLVTLPTFGEDDPELAMFWAVEPRVSIVKDWLALFVPTGGYVGDFMFMSIQTQPGLVLTLPVADGLELNLSGREILFLRAPGHGAWAASAGLGIHLENAILRPEISALGLGDGDEFMFQVGIGVEFISSKDDDDDADADRSTYGGRGD